MSKISPPCSGRPGERDIVHGERCKKMLNFQTLRKNASKQKSYTEYQNSGVSIQALTKFKKMYRRNYLTFIFPMDFFMPL